MLHSLSFDTYYMYLLSATEKKTTNPNYRCSGSLISEFSKFLHASSPIIYPTHIHINTILIENIK